MRVLVAEYICSGLGLREFAGTSLEREGRGMLTAILADLAADPTLEVSTVWARELGESPVTGVRAWQVDADASMASVIREAVDEAEGVLWIAPETDSILESLCTEVRQRGKRSLNCEVSAVRSCGDKFALFRHLVEREISTIPSVLLNQESPPPFEFPIVIKPRDGAGSQATRRIDSVAEYDGFMRENGAISKPERWLVQPFVRGEAISVAAIVGEETEVLPVARQLLCDDRSFQYQGGIVPWETDREGEIRVLVRRVIDSIPGLFGYVGIDLLLPVDGSGPVIVEINPRLTTSYLGYRQVLGGEVGRWAVRGITFPAAARCAGPVHFQADGSLVEASDKIG